MKIKDVMTTDVQFVNPETSVSQVAKLMKDCECGSIPVGDDDKLVGMITDRDIVLRCIAAEKDPLLMRAEECMSPGMLYCYESDDVDDVLENMGEQAIRRLPVVNQNKRLVGIVSFGDVAAACKNKSTCGEAMAQIRQAA